MAGKRKLTKAYRRLDIQKADEINPIPGILGFPINGVNTVEVYNRPGYVYVRLRDNQSEVVQAFNTNVSPVYGLPVLIARDKINKSRYTVLSRDLGRYENWGTSSPYLPRHGAQHSFDPTAVGGDIVWVYNRQFMPLNVYPSGSFGSMNVLISEGTYYLNNAWHFAGNTGTASFTGYKPTGSSARMVLVYLDSNDNPQLVAGSYFASTLTGTSQIFSFIPALPVTTGLPLAGIRLVSGTSIISWDNIYDVRPFIVGDGFIPTGTTGHVIADEGTPLANRPTLDFKGTNVWAIDNAGSNKTDIIVSGSTGGGGSLPNGEIGFGNGTSIISDPYFIYDTSNRQLIVGKNTMDSAGHTIEIWGDEDDGYQSELFMYKYAGTGFIYPPLIRSNMARGTTAYPAPVLSGDKIFELAGYGWSTGTSGDFWAGFKLQAYAIENWLGGAGGRSSTYLLMQLGSINAQGVYNVARFDTSEVNFAGSVNISGTVVPKAFQLRAGANNGYVLTSDADGVGTWAVPTGGGSGTTNNYYYSTPNTVSVFDDGVFKVSGTALSFDAGLIVSVTGTVAYISSTGTSSSSTGTIGHIIEDETTPLTQRSKLSFQGAGVTATDDAGNDRTIVTIPGATGTSGASANNILPIYGNNTFVITGTAAVFNSNLTVSASGTIAYINANAGIGAGLNVVGIFDDGTFKVSGTAISFDSGLYVSSTGTVAYINSSGTSGSSNTVIYTKWDVDAPPTSPSAYDDEFDNNSLSGDWTEFDPDGRLTITEDNRRLTFKVTSGTENLCGIYKSIPDGDFTIAIKINTSKKYNTQFLNSGITLWENPGDTSKKMQTLGPTSNSTSTYIAWTAWTNYTTYSSATSFLVDTLAHKFYLRLRRNSTTYTAEFSSDGIIWDLITSGAIAFTPTAFGIILDNSGTGIDAYVNITFFRYKASDVGVDGYIEGRLMNVYN